MTPEEKLLALIQQDKKQPEAAPAAAKATETPAPAAQAPKPVAAVPPVEESVKAPEPASAEKKLKLAAAAPAPVEPKAVAAPAVPAPAVSPAPPTPAAAGGSEPPAPPSVAAPGKSVRAAVRTGGLQGLVFANRVLAAVVLVLLVGVAYSIASIRSDNAERVVELRDGAGVQPVGVAVVNRESPPPVEAFLDKIAVRDLFQSSGNAVTSSVSVAQGQVSDLKLVGVSIDSASDVESMAIIRNKADSKTYFVKTGQAVGETGYTLGRVLADRAILKIRKQEIELR